MRKKWTFVLNFRPNRRSLILFSAFLLELAIFSVWSAQTRVREEQEGYEVMLPSSAWRAETRPNGAYTHTDFVYGPANEVRLSIRVRLLDQADTPESAANHDLEMRLQFLPGFINSSMEPFVGKLGGVKVAYEYVRGGRLVAAQTYYLKANYGTLFLLRFTGSPDVLERIQDQTESIARSFRTV